MSSVVSAGVVVVEQSVVEQLVVVVEQLVEELVLQETLVVQADTAHSTTPLPLQSEHAEPAPTSSTFGRRAGGEGHRPGQDHKQDLTKLAMHRLRG